MGLEGEVDNMTREKSLAKYKGKFKKYSELYFDPSKLDHRRVRVLETHTRYGKHIIKKGEEGIIGGGEPVGTSMFDLENEVPVYFPERGYELGIEYEKLSLAGPEKIEHSGHKKGVHH